MISEIIPELVESYKINELSTKRKLTNKNEQNSKKSRIDMDLINDVIEIYLQLIFFDETYCEEKKI